MNDNCYVTKQLGLSTARFGYVSFTFKMKFESLTLQQERTYGVDDIAAKEWLLF